MRVVGVLDLLRGSAVHARGGHRDRYEPVRSVAGAAIAPGDAVALARAYVDRLGVGELYVADLDALDGRPPHHELIAAIAAVGVPVLLDIGVRSVDVARQALALRAHRVVVALETLPAFATIRDVAGAIGGERVAFSLDLRDGAPIFAADARMARSDAPERIARRAQEAGAGSLIVIDVARVGSGHGVDLELLARVAGETDGADLLAGGGVRSGSDLVQLADAGCDGALVATALHDGRIGKDDIAAAARYRRVSR